MRRPLIAAALASVSLACASARMTGQASPLVGKPLAISAPRLDGREEHVPDPRAQVTVIDFWASWCDPCRDQMPALDRLYTEHRGAGVEVYAISFDEDRSAVEEFLARAPVGFPVLWDKGGAALAEQMDITRLPTTLLLDRRGVVRLVHLGYERGEAPALDREVRRLLAEGAQAPTASAR